jgi:hypothetical protein
MQVRFLCGTGSSLRLGQRALKAPVVVCVVFVSAADWDCDPARVHAGAETAPRWLNAGTSVSY